MQFTISRQQLNQGLSRVSRLASAKMPLPILNNILLTTQNGRVVFAVTDLELGIQTDVPAEETQPGTFTVPARLLHEFVQASNEDKFQGSVSDNATLTLKGNQTQVKIRGLDASEYPGLPFSEGAPQIKVKAKDFKEAIDLVLYATAIDDTRPVLAGVYITIEDSELVFAATDSYRLAEKRLKIEQTPNQSFSVIVPKRTLQELSRLLSEEAGDISVFVGDNQIQFEYGSTRVVSRLIEGTYPQYKNIMPNEYRTRVTAHLQDLIAALKMSQLFARESGNLINLTVIPGKGVTVESVASQRGEATNQFTAISEGDELKISFNVKYLLDGLSAIQAENVFLEFSGPDRPVMLRPANSKEYVALVMPLKI